MLSAATSLNLLYSHAGANAVAWINDNCLSLREQNHTGSFLTRLN